jgi:hypothetical protein
MEPLRQAPLVIPQLIMSLCAISIATCNKLCEIMTPFHGDKKRPRINVTTNQTTFSWLFDTGAAITCMNANSLGRHLKIPNRNLSLTETVVLRLTAQE